MATVDMLLLVSVDTMEAESSIPWEGRGGVRRGGVRKGGKLAMIGGKLTTYLSLFPSTSSHEQLNTLLSEHCLVFVRKFAQFLVTGHGYWPFREVVTVYQLLSDLEDVTGFLRLVKRESEMEGGRRNVMFNHLLFLLRSEFCFKLLMATQLFSYNVLYNNQYMV